VRTLVINALRLVGNRTAMGRYIEYLAGHWRRMDIPFDRVVLMSPKEISLTHPDNSGKTEIVLRSFGGHSPLWVWEQYFLPRAARGAAILFCPSYSCPLFYRGRIVVANHGIYERLTDEFSWWSRLRTTPLFRLSACRADRVIANSETTKADLIKYFHIQAPQIDVIYPAASDFFFDSYDNESIDQEVTRALGCKLPYVLFVGKLSKRRNVPNLIEAFSRTRKSENLPHHLLIIGPNTANVPVSELTTRHAVSKFVTYLPYLEQAQLARLYAGADLFVLPTIYEGISWTMLEAMASGTAVLTVDHPTLHEGAGDAVMSMPTPSVEDLVKGLTTLLTDPILRRDYAEKGRERAKRFSWESVARETMQILDREATPCDRI